MLTERILILILRVQKMKMKNEKKLENRECDNGRSLRMERELRMIRDTTTEIVTSGAHTPTLTRQ